MSTHKISSTASMAENQEQVDTGLSCWTVTPNLQVAISKSHTPAREYRPQEWQLSSLLQHQAKEMALASTAKLSQPTAQCQVVPNNHLCLRLAQCGSGTKKHQQEQALGATHDFTVDNYLRQTELFIVYRCFISQMFHFTSSPQLSTLNHA